jgi:dethiobiotin synthetase
VTVLVVTGTGTGIGKTVVTSAIAALAIAAGHRVAVLKAAQTGVDAGQPGDVDEVRRLVGSSVTCRELARYPDPLAPATAARRAGLPPVTPATVAAAVRELAAEHDLVLLEGAGGLLVPLDDRGERSPMSPPPWPLRCSWWPLPGWAPSTTPRSPSRCCAPVACAVSGL